ncbi:MAG: hypothetical protein K2P81_16130 [Bacteriovoracaceae bacterium]|nr:hypothetical protein [Bacteriovoracaceae bacterium]
MKSIFGLAIAFLLLPICSAHAELVVNETFKAPLYQLAHPLNHMDTVEDAFIEFLKPYDCIGGKLSYDVIREMRSRIFSKDIPGEIAFNFQVYCKSKDLKEFKFGFDPAGYDEDYSQIMVNMKTKSGVIKKRFCLYATRTQPVKCYAELPELDKLSISF